MSATQPSRCSLACGGRAARLLVPTQWGVLRFGDEPGALAACLLREGAEPGAELGTG
ncbi:MAG: hypothetical protein HZB55_07595 [Deltaproteobacteria bacterium]|nr:hypothetical protein [Deltaproteobacteria bacterium]